MDGANAAAKKVGAQLTSASGKDQTEWTGRERLARHARAFLVAQLGIAQARGA
jgi:hypothetical protein